MQSNGRFLWRRSLEELNAIRNLQAQTLYNVPTEFAIYEDKSNVVQGRTYPGAKDAQVCNLYSSLTADDLRDYVGAGTSGMDDVSANLSREGAGALVAYTAAALVERMSVKTLEARGLNPNVVQRWQREADSLIWQECARRNALESTGRTQRWVS